MRDATAVRPGQAPYALGRSRAMSLRTRRNLRNGLLFISPWIFGFAVFQLYPFLASLYYSLTRYSVMRPPVYVGLTNYAHLVHDPLFAIAIHNTLYLTAISVPLGTVIAIVLALLLNVKIPGQAFFRTVFYLPTVVPVVATAGLFLWILNPQYGLINQFLGLFGIPGPGWTSSPAWSKPSLVLLNIWGVGAAMVIYLASLQDVPTELHEAAQLDGAGALRRTFAITIPLITPVIFFNVITGLIGSLQYFTQAYIMTNGGPANSTLVIALYLYNNAFVYFRMGYASAQAWVLFVLILILTVLVFRLSRRFVFYAGQ